MSARNGAAWLAAALFFTAAAGCTPQIKEERIVILANGSMHRGMGHIAAKNPTERSDEEQRGTEIVVTVDENTSLRDFDMALKELNLDERARVRYRTSSGVNVTDLFDDTPEIMGGIIGQGFDRIWQVELWGDGHVECPDLPPGDREFRDVLTFAERFPQLVVAYRKRGWAFIQVDATKSERVRIGDIVTIWKTCRKAGFVKIDLVRENVFIKDEFRLSPPQDSRALDGPE